MYRQCGIIVSFTVLALGYYSFAENKKEATTKRKSLNILRIYDDNNSEILNHKTEIDAYPKSQKRNKRTALFNDARWPQQKYLSGGIVADHRVKEVWEKGYTGDGVTVAVVDGGLRYTHMEFAGRYDPSLSRDYVDNDLEPNKTDEHGTNCAGVIAGAAINGICGVGIAYNAKIAGIQLTSSGIPEDSVLARAMFPFDGHGIDVFSCSWGPPDVGFKVQGPGPLTRRAFLNGVIKGRNGRGSLYVFSAGNGVLFGDNCAFNGFVNNIHTIGVAALDKNGKPMLSSEPCSAVMTAAFADNLETASASNDQACSSSFGQTSGAAAVVSGIIALGLQARKSLTWRAVHHLIRKSSRMDVIDKSVVPILNKAGFQVSNRVGFGLLDALMFANNAEKFNHSLPPQLMCEVDVERQPLRADSTSFTILIDGTKCNNGIIYHLEHVVATFNLEYFKRGVLGAYITSPKGTRSKVIGHRVFDALAGYKRYENLTTLSVHFWGESSLGEWRVVFKNDLPSQGTGPGTLFGFRLTLYGTATPPFDSTSTTIKETSLSTGAVVGVVLAGVFVFCVLVALSLYRIKRIYSRESNPVDIGVESTHVQAVNESYILGCYIRPPA